MRVEIITDRFEEAYGTPPRGSGAWAFSPVDPNRSDFTLDSVIWCNGTYPDARRVAIKRAKAAGCPALWVCS